MGDRATRAAASVAGAAALAVVALPLVPALTPGWPRAPALSVLVLGGLLALAGIVLAVRRTLTPRALLLVGAFPLYALYVGNGELLTSGDNAATRALPSLILGKGTIDLSATPPFDRQPQHYAGVHVGSRILNRFPSGTAVAALPYAALGLLGSGGRVTPALVSRWEKHAAALLAVLAAALVWAAARRWGDAAALGAGALFGLATPVFTNPAQALWSFTGELVFLGLALFLALRARPLPAWAGAAAGAAFACRPTALLGAAATGVALLATDRRAAARYAAALAGVLAAVCAVQLALYGHPLGAYGAMNTAPRAFNADALAGLAGVLASPSRGLLVFCPWVLLLPLGLPAARRSGRSAFVWALASLGAAGATLAVAATHVKWWGGWSLGPRLATEAAPFLALAAAPLLAGARRLLRAGFLALVAFAAITQLLLAYGRTVRDWDPLVLERVGPRSLWRVRDSQLAVAWGAPFRVGPPAPLSSPGGDELWCSVDDPAEGSTVSGRLRVRGWGRIVGGNLAVTVYLDGVARTPVSTSRAPRPDVCAALPVLEDCSTAGYEVVFDFGPGDTGRHDLVAVFRAPDGRVRRYPAQSFVWKRN